MLYLAGFAIFLLFAWNSRIAAVVTAQQKDIERLTKRLNRLTDRIDGRPHISNSTD
jgi:hypothetical protein